jgi:hypothetical protein
LNHDLGQLRDCRLEAIPDPTRDVLAGRVFEALDLIQVVVVEALIEWGEVLF